MQDRDWYNKVPIKEINELIAVTGWNVKQIYAALRIQELELKISEAEIWSDMKNLHWDDPEYKKLEPIYNDIKRKIENVGNENEN